jgi:hypothetical protein
LTHELLNDYTSAYTASETPFAAWVTVVTRRYESQQSQHKFLSEQMFRAAWFAYVALQNLDGDMECPSCGPSPENTIWDGITLAFNQKHLLPSLKPPTAICHDSLIRERTRYVYKQQLLPDKDLRKLVRRIISGPPPTLMPANSGTSLVANDPDRSRGPGGGENSDDEGVTEANQAAKSAEKSNNEIFARIEGIPLAYEKLASVNAGLGRLFGDQFGLEALRVGRWGNAVYQRFFHQVCLCI